MNLSEMYQEMGIDQDVYAYGQKITEDLKERFSEPSMRLQSTTS